MLDRNSPVIADLVDALLCSVDLMEIMKRAAMVVRNPVAIIDSGYNMLAWSHFESVPDETWLERIRERHWDYDFVAMVKQFTGNALAAGKRSTIVTGLSPLRRRVDILYAGGGLLGYSVVLELEDKLEDTDEDVYVFVRDILTKALAMERAYYLHKGQDSGASILLRDLLRMHFPNRLLLKERIKGSEFDRDTQFQVYSLSLENYSPERARGEKLKDSLQKIFPDSWSSFDSDYIVILLDHAATLRRKPEAFPAFTSFLEENKLVAGQSALFDDLFDLQKRRDETIRTLDIQREIAPRFLIPDNAPVISYEACKILDMLRELPPDQARSYCHSDILIMAEHDRQHQSGYLRTIFEYLNAARSMHATADALHVHHNTVYYRVHKAKEQFGLDFSVEHRNMHYYLSCIILLYLS